MILKMKDTSYISDWGIEIGQLKNSMVLLYIPNDLIEQLSDSFIQKLKLIYKNMGYQAIKEIKRFDKNKYGKELDYKKIIHQPYSEDILIIRYEYSHNLVREWESDIEIIENYSNENQRVDI
jgi:hypothetical protein